MSDDLRDGLDLLEVRIHPTQRTLLCPHCKTEGRNYFMVGQWQDGASLPGECKECGEAFIVHVTSDPNLEAPLRTVAMAIYQVAKSWDHRDIDLTDRVRTHIAAVINAAPGMHTIDPLPLFKVQRNTEMRVEFIPENNTAMRVIEILDEIRHRDSDAPPQQPGGLNDIQGV